MAPDTFREFHRARRRGSALRAAGIAVVAAAAATGLTLWGVSAAGAGGPAIATDGQSVPRAIADAPPRSTDIQLPTLSDPGSLGAPGLPNTGAASWSIAIDTTGYQTELDECLWVRMDLQAAAPIVGAHNYCGGDVVLEMDRGDTVSLSGAGLDGQYLVTDIRDARAGDPAGAATAGMAAVAILQTCYFADDGTVRLVGLLPAP